MFLPPSWPPLPSLFALKASTTLRALPLELYPPILFRSSATTINRVRSPWYHRFVPHFPRLPAFVLFPRLCLTFSNTSLVLFCRLPGGWSYFSTSSGSKAFPTDTLSATTFCSCVYYCIFRTSYYINSTTSPGKISPCSRPHLPLTFLPPPDSQNPYSHSDSHLLPSLSGLASSQGSINNVTVVLFSLRSAPSLAHASSSRPSGFVPTLLFSGYRILTRKFRALFCVLPSLSMLSFALCGGPGGL